MQIGSLSKMISAIPVPAFSDNYIWLVHDADNKAVIVDPGAAQPVLSALTAFFLEPVAILITHHHYDHIGGIHEILARHDVPVFGPAHEAIQAISYRLSDGDQAAIPSTAMRFNVLDVPGHTAGHIAYLGHGQLLCGDTLFAGGCGRLFEGTATQMYRSLQKLANLPEATRVYCAHEYTLANLTFALQVEPRNIQLVKRFNEVKQLRDNKQPTVPSTIGVEKLTNPFLRCGEADVRTAAEKYAGKSLGSPEQVFTVIRAWKDSF